MIPLISIIIVNYNGKKWLKNCLTSLYKQTYKNFEIIFIDNASSDDSVEYVKKIFPKIKIIANKENYGFAKGNNIGVKISKGKFIVLLNNDTITNKHYLQNFIKAFDEIPNLAVAQSKILLLNNKKLLDVCGAFWTDSTILYHYGYNKPDSKKYQKSFRVFSVKGASMIIKKEIIDKVGLFDDDFWCYYEETDFCHRVWLAGYECWYYPKATMYHAVGGTSTNFNNEFIQFHNYKNKLTSFLKNFQLSSLIFILPAYLILNLFLIVYYFVNLKFAHIAAIFKALLWSAKNFKKILLKRKTIQKLRVVADKEFFLKIRLNPPLSYYKYLPKGIENYEDVKLPYDK